MTKEAKDFSNTRERAKYLIEQLSAGDWTVEEALANLALSTEAKRIIFFGPPTYEEEDESCYLQDREARILVGNNSIDKAKINVVLKELYPNGVPVGEMVFEIPNA